MEVIITHADNNVLSEKENIPSDQTPEADSSIKISIETPSEGSPDPNAASFSTPQVTVKDRVKEYIHRTGHGDETSSSGLSGGNRSLASSQNSLRASDTKDGKEWILAASACDLYAMHRMLSGDKSLVNYRFPFNGFTALHFAAKGNKPECCKFLVENGASSDAKTYAGQTPLHLACQHECRDAMDYLLKVSGKAAHTPDYAGKLPHELIRSREAFADILYRMTSSGLEKRGSFLGDYPVSRQLLGGSRMSEAVGSAASATTAASSWLSGVRASFRGKSAQPKLKVSSISGGGGSQLQVPSSHSVGGRVSQLFHSSPGVAAAIAARAAKRSHSHAYQSGVGCSDSDGFAVPAPPPPQLPPQPPTHDCDPPSILDNLTNAVTSGCAHLHLLTTHHQHQNQNLTDGGGGKSKKGNRTNKITL